MGTQRLGYVLTAEAVLAADSIWHSQQFFGFKSLECLGLLGIRLPVLDPPRLLHLRQNSQDAVGLE